VEGKHEHVGIIQDVLNVKFISLYRTFLDLKWFKLIQHEPQPTIRKDPNGLFAINSTKIPQTEEPFIYPRNCEQVFFFVPINKIELGGM